MVVVPTGGIKCRAAMGAARIAFEVSGDGQKRATGATENRQFVPLALGPRLERMAGQHLVTIFAGVKKAAATHLDGEDVRIFAVVSAASLRVEIQAMNDR